MADRVRRVLVVKEVEVGMKEEEKRKTRTDSRLAIEDVWICAARAPRETARCSPTGV